jgi:hypothetical protein
MVCIVYVHLHVRNKFVKLAKIDLLFEPMKGNSVSVAKELKTKVYARAFDSHFIDFGGCTTCYFWEQEPADNSGYHASGSEARKG